MRNFVNLGEYTRVRTGKLDANASSPNGKYPFFTCSQEPLRIETYSYDCECVLVAGNGDLNVKYYNGKFDAYQRTYIIESLDKDKLLPRYMFYFLELYIETLRKESIGGVIKYIKLGNLTNAKIFLPDLATQQKIIDILDKSVAAIACRKKQLASYDMLVKSQFIEMFGEIGSDKNGWGMRPLAECCDVNPKKGEDARIQKGMEVSFVPMQSVSEQGDIDTTVVKTYEEVQKGFTYFSEGDVLFAKITPCMENGKGAIARGLKNSVGFGSTEFHVLRPKAGVCNSEWIYAITSFPQFRQDAARKMTGSAGQRRVPASFLASYMVSCPPFELQEQFTRFVEQTDKSKVLFTQKLFFQLYMAICVNAFEKNARILYNCRREVAR